MTAKLIASVGADPHRIAVWDRGFLGVELIQPKVCPSDGDDVIVIGLGDVQAVIFALIQALGGKS